MITISDDHKDDLPPYMGQDVFQDGKRKGVFRGRALHLVQDLAISLTVVLFVIAVAAIFIGLAHGGMTNGETTTAHFCFSAVWWIALICVIIAVRVGRPSPRAVVWWTVVLVIATIAWFIFTPLTETHAS